MLGLALRTFLDRWVLLAGAVVSLAVGVSLTESALVVAAAAATPPAPAGSRSWRPSSCVPATTTWPR